jgi:uncharacterized membrane protein AbrB (regulator of aidB expression)
VGRPACAVIDIHSSSASRATACRSHARFVLAAATHVDPLTAYLATSPGGVDSVAIIAAGSNVNLPFVMAMQTARFLVILSIGPSLARFMTRRAATTEIGKSSF